MKEPNTTPRVKGISFYEKYLTLWVALCIVAGILLGKIAPTVARTLDGMAIYVGDAPHLFTELPIFPTARRR